MRLLLSALGGAENIRQVENCFTRLRVTVWDEALLDMEALLALPHKGVVLQGRRLQLVYGLQSARICRALTRQMDPDTV